MLKDIYLTCKVGERTLYEVDLSAAFDLTVNDFFPDNPEKPTGLEMLVYRVDDSDERFARLISWADESPLDISVQDIEDDEPWEEDPEPSLDEYIQKTETALQICNEQEAEAVFGDTIGVVTEAVCQYRDYLMREKRQEGQPQYSLGYRARSTLDALPHDQPLSPDDYQLLHDACEQLVLLEKIEQEEEVKA